jgi:putative glutamine amidotransferase
MLLLLLLGCQVVNPPPSPPPAPPRIGVTGSTSAISLALGRAGAEVVALEPGSPASVLSDLDALVLGPGADLDPGLYGELPHPTTRLVSPERHDTDLRLAEGAWAVGLPVLGICLGAQEMAVFQGGDLVQDLEDELRTKAATRPAVDHWAAHLVTPRADTPFAEWYPVPVMAESRHHQAVDRLPVNLRLGANAPDGTVAGFFDPAHVFFVGVQIHPELHPEDHAGLWQAFVVAAASGVRSPQTPWSPVESALPVCAAVQSPFRGDLTEFSGDRRSLATLQQRLGSRYGDHRTSFVAGHKHGGLDLRTTPGEDVFAVCEGRVADLHLGFPHRTVVVEHHLADRSIVYSSSKHITDIGVAVGDRVTAETRLGRVFNDEEQRRAPWGLNHLHFELRHDISDGGAASWRSMSMAELDAHARDPWPFFQGELGP